MLAHEEEKCFFLHKHFLLCSNDRTFQYLKQWQPTSFVSALSLESMRVVSCYKVHKRLKMVVAFETLFLLAKPHGYPTFEGKRF